MLRGLFHISCGFDSVVPRSIIAERASFKHKGKAQGSSREHQLVRRSHSLELDHRHAGLT